MNNLFNLIAAGAIRLFTTGYNAIILGFSRFNSAFIRLTQAFPNATEQQILRVVEYANDAVAAGKFLNRKNLTPSYKIRQAKLPDLYDIQYRGGMRGRRFIEIDQVSYYHYYDNDGVMRRGTVRFTIQAPLNATREDILDIIRNSLLPFLSSPFNDYRAMLEEGTEFEIDRVTYLSAIIRI